ncbi:hypothetical protein BH11ACT8_BH11ACT8_01620 [soil metagenome]
MTGLHHELTIACDPQRAFTLFTLGMGTWWDPAYSPDPEAFTGIEVEPFVGGALTMLLGDARYVFGRVRTWEPGVRFTQSFCLAMSPESPSEIDVHFAEDEGGVCLVSFHHGGWSPANRAFRTKYRDWPYLLGQYAEAAARLS